MDIGTPLSLAGGVESLLPPGSPATSSASGTGVFFGGLVDAATRPFSLDPALIEREALRITEQNQRIAASKKMKTNAVIVPGNGGAQ